MYARWLAGYARQQRAARESAGVNIRLSLVTAIPAAVVSLVVVPLRRRRSRRSAWELSQRCRQRQRKLPEPSR